MHQRLQQLERLVMSIAAQPNTMPNVMPRLLASTSPPVGLPLVHALTNSSTDRGIMRASDSQSYYLGSDHWAAIMDSIAELKDHFQEQEQIRLSESPEQAQGSVGTAGSDHVQQNTHSLLLTARASTSRILSSLLPFPVELLLTATFRDISIVKR
jgi:hypothetical protein